MTAEEVCIQVALNNNLSPSRARKPFTVKKFVREDRAGQSPGKRGRKFKICAELLDAVAAKQSISQANGLEMTSRDVLKTLKAATHGSTLEASTEKQTINGWLRGVGGGLGG